MSTLKKLINDLIGTMEDEQAKDLVAGLLDMTKTEIDDAMANMEFAKLSLPDKKFAMSVLQVEHFTDSMVEFIGALVTAEKSSELIQMMTKDEIDFITSMNALLKDTKKNKPNAGDWYLQLVKA